MNAKIRLNALSQTESEIVWELGASLKDIFELVCKQESISEEVEEFFAIFLEGYEIPVEMWETTKPSAGANVLIAIRPEGGSGRSVFKQLAVIAVVAAVSYASGGTATPWLAPWAAGALGAAAGVATSLTLNKLLPDVIPDVNIGGLDAEIEESQMYTVSSQSNKVKKYGGVPKVFGTHRMFPNVVGSPYTTLAADDETKELVQFFHAVYDFGLGPLVVSDLKIGETLLSDFSDINYALIDPNKPDYADPADEPVWDQALTKNLILYKGDGDQTQVGIAIDENLEEGADIDDYQIIRNVPGDANDSDQEIDIVFVAPAGLDTIGTDGAHAARSVELEVSIAEEGTEDWFSFADNAKVFRTEATGITTPEMGTAYLYPPTLNWSESNPSVGNFLYYTTRNNGLNTIRRTYSYIQKGNPGSDNRSGSPDRTVTVSYYSPSIEFYAYLPKGSTSIVAQSGLGAEKSLTFQGHSLGQISSEVSLGNGYSTYYLDTATSTEIPIYSAYRYWEQGTYFQRWTVSGTTTPAALYHTSLSTFTLTDSTSKAVWASIKVYPIKRTNYKVRVRRLRSYGGYTYSITDGVTWSSIGVRYDRSPINTKQRHVFLELRVRATNQLSGTISNLSGTVTSVLDVYDPATETWSLEPTNNPAWVFCDLMTGTMNKRATPKDRLDMDTILEWRDFCDATPDTPPNHPLDFVGPRYTTNFVLDYQTTLHQVLNSVSNACQASLNIVDGKYGVLLDIKKDIPVQVFTPRNSWGFTSSRLYGDDPHAYKVRFINPDTWEVDEMVVYDDGQDYSTATEFSEIKSFACTDFDQTWRYGRYIMAQAKLRRESISIQADFEHLVCSRGDFVQITQDVMKVGGVPARVVWAEGNQVRIDTNFSPEEGLDYGYTYRPVDAPITTSTMTITSPNTATVDGPLPTAGDLIIWGEVGKLTFDCLVKAINPGEDLVATLTLVEKADAIYDAESSGDLPQYDPFIAVTADSESKPPKKVENLSVVENTYECTGYKYQYYISLDWTVPKGSVYEGFEVYVDTGKGYNLYEVVTSVGYKYLVLAEDLAKEHTFKIVAVASNGNKLPIADVDTVSATPLPKTSAPSDVEAVFLNVTSETIQIDWPAVADCDILEYLIRFSPTLSGSWEISIPLQRVDSRTTLATSQARTGTYLIKAVDFNGNESVKAATAITSIPELTNLNVIAETNDFPDLLGSKQQVIKSGDALTLQEKVVGGVGTGEYYSTGEYFYKNFLDLGDIYTVRLQSSILAEGFTQGDIMANWPTLDDVDALSSSRHSEWDVETHYRATEAYNTMSEWPTMSAIDPISEGVQDVWSPWRKLTIGDFSGRIFQFKLKLMSNKPSVTPRVIDGVIKADMSDRVDTFNNLVSNIGWTTVTYKYPYKGPGTTPSIQITQDAAQAGDRFEFRNKSLSSFEIIFYDIADNPVSRQFDVAAAGYGRKTNTVL